MDHSPEVGGPRAAYLHLPFCRHRCGYCNFTVIAGRDDLAESYLDALSRELATVRRPRSLTTLFIGGGTPTHLQCASLERLLALVHRWFTLESGGEWTVEANPEDFAEDGRLGPEGERKLQLLQDAGVTRLSLGAQSFDASKLRTLERSHTAATIRSVVQSARERFRSVSLDLIFAAPGETRSTWTHDLNQALELAPQHVSTYGMTVEKGTAFYNRLVHGSFAEVDEDTQREMYLEAIARLTAAGFEHYEVSNFARPGHRCRHNEAYWLGDEYFAFGAGAARYVDGVRQTNHRSTTTYMKRVLAGESPIAESEPLDEELRARERLVFGLRRLEGVDRDWFRQQTGREIEQLAGPEIAGFESLGLLTWEHNRLKLTREGLLVSDSLWPSLIVPQE